jgi:hypothetical protein
MIYDTVGLLANIIRVIWQVWGRGEICTGLCWGSLKERDNLEDLGIDLRIILQRIFNKYDWGRGLIDLAQNMENWRAFVHTVMKLRVP